MQKMDQNFSEGSSKSFIPKNLANAELVWVGKNKNHLFKKRKHVDAENLWLNF